MTSTETLLPVHGHIVCRKCWSAHEGENEFLSEDKRFKLVNDPAAWGSRNPKILVVGITKGNTQSDAMTHCDFDNIAYKGFRPRLTAVLHSVGLARDVNSVSDLIKKEESAYAWGSVVRCSLTGFDKEKEKEKPKDPYSSKSGLVLPAFSHKEMSVVVSNCFSKYLGSLPSRVELVVMLGNAKKYLEKMRQLVSQFYREDFRYDPVDEGIAYKGGGRLWVHVGHPSPGNGHYTEFLNGDPASGQGKKRELAMRAIERSGILRSF
jgi:hypothetical protein